MDAVEGLVEDPLCVASPGTEKLGENVAKRAVGSNLDLLRRPGRHSHGKERVTITLDDRLPSVDQGVVPVEQNRARGLESGQAAHVTGSPVAAKRTYSSRRRRAVGPTFPSPTA